MIIKKEEASSATGICRVMHLGKTVRLVWQSGPGWMSLNIGLMILQGVLPLVGLYLLKLVIDSITERQAEFERIAILLALTGTVVLLGALSRSLVNYVRVVQTQIVSDHVYDLLHAKSIELDLGYYEDPGYYDTLHLARREGTYRPARIVNGVVQVGQNSLSLIAMGALLFSFHWAVPLILFIAAIPGSLMRLRFAGKLHEWQRRRTVEERRAAYFHSVLLDHVYSKEVRLFNLGAFFKNKFRELRQSLLGERRRLAWKQLAADASGQAGGTLVLFGTYTYIAYRAVQGEITLGDLVMYFQAFQRGLVYLQEMLSGLADLYEDNLFLSSLYRFLFLKRNVTEPAYPVRVPRPLRAGIELHGVGFHYPGSSNYVLRNIDLRIRPGEVIGIVGENGSGKTTLVKLLCRFYDPTEGIITLDGINIRKFRTPDLRRQFSVMFQDFSRYYTTIRENIRYGNIDIPPDSELIETVARLSGMGGMIAKLDNGYDTVLGKWLENGEELSIGELQKLALARALIRNAQVMVLDEPTSAMDAKSEYTLFMKFREMTVGRATILISHRLSSLRMADKIYVMQYGKIVESGTHEQLIKDGGAYADMVVNQASAYK